ncbi:MAG: hypothetical protein ACJAX2_002190 [Celeribacter sp.]|jgi:hypothetical protein
MGIGQWTWPKITKVHTYGPSQTDVTHSNAVVQFVVKWTVRHRAILVLGSGGGVFAFELLGRCQYGLVVSMD